MCPNKKSSRSKKKIYRKYGLFNSDKKSLKIKKIKDEGAVHCRLNNWTSLSLSTKDFDDHPKLPLRPYQTILLLEKQDKFLESLPKDASPSLRRLVEVCKPTKNFTTLQQETGIPLAQLYRIAAHLIYWGKAKVIDFLTKLNVYIVNPAPQSHYPYLAMEFQQDFPSFKLYEILQSFSYPKSIGDHMHRHHALREFVEIVIWLLRHDLLIQLHKYIYFSLPSNKKKRSIDKRKNSFNKKKRNFSKEEIKVSENVYELSPIPLTPEEDDYIEKNLNDGTPLYKTFKELCPYFRGKHHLEEIMWRENMNRDDLFKVIKKYSHVLALVNLTNQ